MSKLYINQSMIKDLIKYQKGEFCGLLFMNKWILHQYGKGTKSNDLGHYFEWLCTGALAKGETDAPKPEITKKGEITADFQVAKKQSEYFHTLKAKYGFQLVSAGRKIIADDQWIGTLDIEASWKSIFETYSHLKSEKNPNHIVIIDLKFSGLLDDKWSEFGWNTEMLPRKQGTMLQAKHYKFLFWKEYGFNPPFFFFVFDSKEFGRAKIIYVDIDEYELMAHERFLQKAKLYLEQQLEIGFKPLPNYETCIKCAYNQWCAFKEDVPRIINVKPE